VNHAFPNQNDTHIVGNHPANQDLFSAHTYRILDPFSLRYRTQMKLILALALCASISAQAEDINVYINPQNYTAQQLQRHADDMNRRIEDGRRNVDALDDHIFQRSQAQYNQMQQNAWNWARGQRD